MPGPSFRAAPVRVRVPASAANLGPGFDAFGLALGLYDDVVARIGESGVRVDVAGEGADDVPRDKRHLVVRAMRHVFDRLGGQPRGIELVCANRIPHGRGLGSSAAAIVAGVLAARELVLGGIPDAEVLALATEIEGHPDNVAAALLGGCTLAWTTDSRVDAVRLPVHASLAPVAFVPTTKSSTAKARKLLPATVPHADAAVNAGRAALLVEAIGRRPDLLLAATEDRLHQPYRAEAMPRTAALVRRLREEGVPAVVSGAGPTVLALATGDGAFTAPRGWTVLPLPVDTAGAQVLAV
jgi:homoserine kinase